MHIKRPATQNIFTEITLKIKNNVKDQCFPLIKKQLFKKSPYAIFVCETNSKPLCGYSYFLKGTFSFGFLSILSWS